MRRFLTKTLVLSLLSLAGSSLLAQDGLFSDVSINSVFTKPGSAPQQPYLPPQQQPQAPPTGGTALAEAIKAAGFEPKQVAEQVVQTKVQLDQWSFPVLVTSDAKKEEVVVVLLLSVLKDEKQLPASKLLELLDASRAHAPAFFAYSSQRKRIELYRTIEGSSPSAETLKAEINRLAQIAKATESLWNLALATVQKPVQKPNNAPAAAPALSLTGKWSAAKSDKEAFALLLAADGKYTLVHVASGKQTKSKGTYSLSGTQLTLSGSDGTRLAGSVSATSQQQFVFTPQGGKVAPLTFKRAS